MPKPHISRAPLSRPLNLMQQRFVHEYLVDEVATAAARRAGYSGKRARWQACDLMRNPRIQAAIAQARARRAGPLTREMAVEALRAIGQANVLDYARPGPDGALELDLWRLERDRAGAVRELTVVERTDPATGVVTRTVGFKLADRSAALMKLLPMLGSETAAVELARGREEGAAAVAALSAEQFGRFRAGLGRREPVGTALAAFLAREESAQVRAARVRAEQALAEREAEVNDMAEGLDAEWKEISAERQELIAMRDRLMRDRAALSGAAAGR